MRTIDGRLHRLRPRRPDDDAALGRVPGLLPPLRPTVPLLWLVALLTVLGVVVVALVRPPGPLDQPDLAYQRDGLLDAGPRLPEDVAGVRFGGRVLVLLFQRQAPGADDLARWLQQLEPDREVVLVLPAASSSTTRPLPVPVRVDATGELARAVQLPQPNDGGPGIGYAVIDAQRTVRYSTLDPSWLSDAFEVATIATSVERDGSSR